MVSFVVEQKPEETPWRNLSTMTDVNTNRVPTCVIFKSQERGEERCERWRREMDAGGLWADGSGGRKYEDERKRWEARRCQIQKREGEMRQEAQKYVF